MSFDHAQTKLTGQEPFINTDTKRLTVLDFWQYAFSTLSDNIIRGKLAEFLVEVALKDLDNAGVSAAWADWDVEDFDGTKIEVKCSAYIQNWDQPGYSQIRFTRLQAKEGYYSSAVKAYNELVALDYKADIYVFALQHHRERGSFNILDMNQWSFYVVKRDTLGRITNKGKSVSLATLEKNDIKANKFEELCAVVQQLKSIS